MQSAETFGNCLRRILAEKNTSASALARLLGFRSRNSIFRILQDEVSYDKQKEFFDLLCRQRLFSDEYTIGELRRALEIARIGPENYWCTKAMERLVFSSLTQETEPIQVEITAENDRGGVTVDDLNGFLKRLFEGKSVAITMVGCCDQRFFAALAAALHSKADNCQVEIHHYLEARGTDFIGALLAMQPLLYDTCYHACMLDDQQHAAQVRQFYSSNSMMIDGVDRQGQRRFFQLSWTDLQKIRLLEHCSETVYRYYFDCVHQYDAVMEPINKLFDGPCEPQDYLAYTETYFQLENKRDLYDIKQDVPINYIHPDLLVRSVIDGFRQTGFADEAKLMPLVGKFYDIHLKRYNNFINKRKVTHTIFSADAMRQFALTGKTTDHFFAMRPYTPQERISILQDLRQQTLTNPYFTIYFFRDGVQPVPQEFGLYDGIGVLMTKAFTDYCLDGGHSETLICQKEFCNHFKDYFLHGLLAEKVMTQSETIERLDELVVLAGGMQG